MNLRRVVVTGLGAVSPFGLGVDKLWTGLKAGESAIRPIELFDVSDFPVKFAGEVKDYVGLDHFEKRKLRHLDRVTQFALLCSDEAIKDSGIDLDAADRTRIGTIVGSGIGGLDTTEQQVLTLHNRGVRRVSPFLVPMMMINAASGEVAIRHGLKGPNFCVSSACASGNHALGLAMQMIRYGMADAVLAGGSEAALTPIGLAGFCAARALSTRNEEPTKASRPFDKDRDGFVFGEGGALLFLESLEHAQARGARIYAEFTGFSNTDDAGHITAPSEDGEGARRAIQGAIEDAKLEPSAIDYVNAHGTSTSLNDVMETKAIKDVFGDHAYKLAVSSTKSMIGHLLGASAGIEAVIMAKAIQESIAPPTINHDEPDPACDLDYVPNEARSMEINHAISNSFGFGGHNTCSVFSKFAE
tara:strand:+ start:53 stop:1297 length:1245 start_codon:yes stop_codon:yes gene_type:complete